MRRNTIKLSLALAVLLVVAQFGSAQSKQLASNDSSVRAGTKISAQLEGAVDAKSAKPGDEVTARVTQNVKQDGKVVVHKGDRLVGRVNKVEAAQGAQQGSNMDLTFDRLVSGGSTTQLNTVVSALVSPRSGAGEESQGDELPTMGSSPLPMGGGGGRGGGGLLGGATSGVGSAVGAVGSTTGSVGSTVTGATQSTVTSATRAGIATPTKMIHIDSSALAENQTGLTSTLSTKQGGLRLESGTQMQFRVAAQGNVRAR